MSSRRPGDWDNLFEPTEFTQYLSPTGDYEIEGDIGYPREIIDYELWPIFLEPGEYKFENYFTSWSGLWETVYLWNPAEEGFIWTHLSGANGTSNDKITINLNEPTTLYLMISNRIDYDQGVYQINITADDPNRPPTAKLDTGTVTTGQSITIDVLANDSDYDGDYFYIVSITEPENGFAQINFNDTVTYAPDPGFVGTDSFEYEIWDRFDNRSTGTVRVTVSPEENASPIAKADVGAVTAGEAITIDVLKNDTDEDGDSLSVVLVTQPETGSVKNNRDGTVTYSATEDFVGTESFEYRIADSAGNRATGVVEVTVSPKKNADPEANNDQASVKAGEEITINVLINDIDTDGDLLTVSGYTLPKTGTLFENQGGLFTYMAPRDFHGSVSFDYWIVDGASGTDTAKVTITVTERDMGPQVYRLFNTESNMHFYTASAVERDFAMTQVPSFESEGASFFAISDTDPDAVPVFRFFNRETGVHFYTISEDEKAAIDNTLDQFEFEGAAYHAFSSRQEGSIPLFRFFNNETGAHFFTPDPDERDLVHDTLPHFQYEGPAYYVDPILIA